MLCLNLQNESKLWYCKQLHEQVTLDVTHKQCTDLHRTRQKDGQLYGLVRNTAIHINGSMRIPYLCDSQTTKHWKTLFWRDEFLMRKTILFTAFHERGSLRPVSCIGSQRRWSFWWVQQVKPAQPIVIFTHSLTDSLLPGGVIANRLQILLMDICRLYGSRSAAGHSNRHY